MNIIISEQTLYSNNFKPFTKEFNKIFVSVDEEFEDQNFKLTEKNVSKLFNVLSYSWDGDIYWFENQYKEKVLNSLNSWFKKEENHVDVDDNGISNCFFIKDTPNGICLIDTQLDMSSNISSFFEDLEKQHPGISYQYYSDSHLIDNLYLGRDSINDEFDTMYLLYKENVIDASFFFRGLAYIDFEDPLYKNIVPLDKKIFLTGTFPISRDEVADCLEEAGLEIAKSIKKDSWLWLGEQPTQHKVTTAQEKNATCSTIAELIDFVYGNYMKNKKTQKLKI